MVIDIKELIEKEMTTKGYTRSYVCKEMGIAPQGWSKKLHDAKWGVICKVCDIIGIKLVDLLQDKEQTSNLIECPHCHNAIKLTAENT